VEIKNRVDIDIIYDFIVFTKDNFLFTRVTFFRKERFNSCPKITSFGTSRAAFQKIILISMSLQSVKDLTDHSSK
jgi:hypothetical protein